MSVDQTSRRTSVESSIEIQLNAASQSSSKVFHEIPASGSGITLQYNTVQDVRMAQQPRKLSIDVEPSPVIHTSSVNLPTTSGLVLTGETSGHSVKSTSMFQLQKSTVEQEIASATDDPTPWRRKSIPREPSIPREEPIPEKVTSTATLTRSTVQTAPPISNRPSRWAAQNSQDSSVASSTRSTSRVESTVQQSSVPSSPAPARSSFASRYEANIQSNASATLSPAPSRSSFASRYETTVQKSSVPAAQTREESESRKTSTVTATLSNVSSTNRSRFETSLDRSAPVESTGGQQASGSSTAGTTSTTTRYETTIDKSSEAPTTVSDGQAETRTHRSSYASRYESSIGKGAPSELPKVKASGASVRALAQKFIQTGEEKSQPQVVSL